LGYYFFLDKKVAKNQNGKNLLPARPTPRPVFRRAFASFFTLFLLLNHFHDNSALFFTAQAAMLWSTG